MKMEHGLFVVQSVWRKYTGGSDAVVARRRLGHTEAGTADGDAPGAAESQGRDHSRFELKTTTICRLTLGLPVLSVVTRSGIGHGR